MSLQGSAEQGQLSCQTPMCAESVCEQVAYANMRRKAWQLGGLQGAAQKGGASRHALLRLSSVAPTGPWRG